MYLQGALKGLAPWNKLIWTAAIHTTTTLNRPMIPSHGSSYVTSSFLHTSLQVRWGLRMRSFPNLLRSGSTGLLFISSRDMGWANNTYRSLSVSSLLLGPCSNLLSHWMSLCNLGVPV